MLVSSSVSAMNEFSKRASTVPDPALISENKTCPGCHLSVVNENGGVVVAFGQSFFHVDCFKCAKCGDHVTADTNLLLLSDGSPICANCSYSCNVCKLPILDEAIMTGDDSYHAHCFKCKVCSNRIDELVFAKTSQGIYCMNCHNQRVARSRRHQQRKKEQAAAAANANGSGSGRSQERQRLEEQPSPGMDALDSGGSRLNDMTSPSRGPPTTPSRTTTEFGSSVDAPQLNGGHQTPRYQSKSATLPMTPSTSLDSSDTSYNSPYHRSDHHPTMSAPISGYSRQKTRYSGDGHTYVTDSPAQQSTLSIQRTQGRTSSDSAPPASTLPPTLSVPVDSSRRKSRDDSVRPLNILMQQDTNSTSVNAKDSSNLSPQGSRSDQRRLMGSALEFSTSSRRGSTSSNVPSSSPKRRPETPSGNEELRPSYSPPSEELTSTSRPSRSHEKSSLSSPISASPSNLKLDSAFQHRPRTASTHRDPGRRETDAVQPPSFSSVTMDRTMSASVDGSEASSTLSSRSGEGVGPLYPAHGRLTPLGPLNGSFTSHMRPRRSLDDRPSSSPTPSINGKLSPTTYSGQHTAWSPTSPTHHVDVPIGIESESETDRESDERIDNGDREDVVPQDAADITPMKQSKREPKGARPPRLNLEPSRSNGVIPDGSNVITITDHEDPSASEISRESSPVEQTSRATFIAPALPPIRISMSGTDFGDFLKFSDTQSPERVLDKIGETDETPMSRLTADGQRALAPVDQVQTSSTPTSDITILGADEVVGRKSSQGSSTVIPNGHSPHPSVSSITTSSFDGRVSTPPSKAHGELDLSDETPRRQPMQHMALVSEATMTNSTRERSSSDSSFGRPDPPRTHSHGLAITETSMKVGSARSRIDASDLVAMRLHEALDNATDRNSPHMKFDREFVHAIVTLVEQRKEEYLGMKGKLDGLKRASQQYMDGLNGAQSEYERELSARRDAEAEVTRLRVLLSGQAMKLSALSGETRRQEAHVQLTKDISDKVFGLERDLSDLRAERDITLAEVEVLSASKGNPGGSGTENSPEATGANLSRNITTRLDKIKKQYKRELLPLTQQRDRLEREIEELKAQRDLLLEETTVLNVRNEELAQLTAQYARRMETAEGSMVPAPYDMHREKSSHSLDRARLQHASQSLASHSSTTLNDDVQETKVNRTQKLDSLDVPAAHFRPQKFLKWSGKTSREQLSSKEPAIHVAPPEYSRPKVRSVKEHVFQQQNGLRFGKCDHCGDKMWGSHLRCSSCHIAIHPRCLNHIHLPCSQSSSVSRDESSSQLASSPPSMFGRDLSDQVRSDSRREEHSVPVIVEKCIAAVDALALDYEGIYRKTGGSGQSKIITQLFERGNYAAFDLHDTDRFNDICSVTSVLKTYFRSLPDPLFTYALHENFIAASTIRDPNTRGNVLAELVAKLPKDHYNTARMLMLHLHRVSQHNEVNLMTARNLGVVFGPTLMRSQDANAEFSDMAGKALTVEWVIENALNIFSQSEAPN